MELVSVIMPAYNASKFIKEAIVSVFNQSYSNWELIVVDDCSTDNTYEIMCEYAKKDQRVRAIKNDKNKGVAETRNYALDLSKGEYIAFLDSDDIWHTNKLEIQVNSMKEEKVDFCFSSYSMMDEDGNQKCKDYMVGSEISYQRMLITNVIGCSTMMLSRKIVDQYRFSLDFYHEDYVLWLKLLKDGFKGHGISEVLVDYRVMGSSKAGNKKKSAMYRYTIYREYLKLPRLKSMYYLVQYAFYGIKKYRKMN